MSPTIRNRLLVILGLVILAVVSLIPRNVTIRERGPDGQMRNTTVRRVPLSLGLDLRGGIHLALEIDESGGPVANREDAIDRALTVIRTRIDEFGVAEPLIQKEGTDRIVVELAGVKEPGRARAIVERSAFLEWRITDMDNQFGDALETIDLALTRVGVRSGGGAATPLESLLGGLDSAAADSTTADSTAGLTDRPLSEHLFGGGIPGEYLVLEEQFVHVDSLINHPAVQRALPRGIQLMWASEPTSNAGRSYRPLYAVDRRSLLSGDALTDADATIDPTTNQAIVRFSLTRRGGRVFQRETGQHINDYMAIILDGRVFRQPPIIRSQIGREGQIELGSQSVQEAQDLALVLRAGALPAPLQIVEERNVGPSLGLDSIRKGRNAAVAAVLLVVLVMAAYYRTAGLLAIGALVLYVLFTFGGLAMFGATLTLPGLAGFVLSLGMAVDANVLIFERIREELKLAKTGRLAVDSGFQHAMPAIIDANVTTVITAAFLFQFGTGPVQGFAVTLIVGIVASLITAIFVTRTFFMLWLQRRDATKELTI
ncbi:MAG TPA: protein translocase subunit SecD [Gemmatimonadales bacterium]|jgi:preprotein translocase subunit SecD